MLGGDAEELNPRSSEVRLRILLQAFPPIGSYPADSMVVLKRAGQPMNLSRSASASFRGILALVTPDLPPHQVEGFSGRLSL